MALKTDFSSPYSRMNDLAIEVSSKQLKKRKLEATLKELYPEGNVPEYFTLLQTLVDRLKVEMYQAFSQDECLQRLLPKMKGESLAQCVEIYGGSTKSMDSIERTLNELNYHRPPRFTAKNNWCVIC